MYCIYGIKNTGNGKVYIGQTTVGFKKRIKEHKSQLKNMTHHNLDLQSDWINYGESYFEFFIVCEGIISREELDCLEIKYISEFDSFRNGYNFTTGGSDFFASRDSSRLKMSKTHRKTRGLKKVIQLDLHGNFIREWSCVAEAAKTLGISHSGISGAAKKSDSRTCHGFIWVYEQDYPNFTMKGKKYQGHNGKPILQLTLNGEFVKRWENASAVTVDGFCSNTVTLCCNGKINQHKGFMFVYEDGTTPFKDRGSIKRISQYTKDGIFVRELDCAVRFEQYGFNVGGVLRCCHGKIMYHKGYVFVFSDGSTILKTERKKSKLQKEISQFTLDGTFIRTLPSALAFVEYGFTQGAILRVCQGLARYHKGHIFKYTDGTTVLKTNVKNKPNQKKITQFTQDWVFVRELNSARDFENFGFNNSCVLAVCHGRSKHHKGFLFRFSKDIVKE